MALIERTAQVFGEELEDRIRSLKTDIQEDLLNHGMDLKFQLEKREAKLETVLKDTEEKMNKITKTIIVIGVVDTLLLAGILLEVAK